MNITINVNKTKRKKQLCKKQIPIYLKKYPLKIFINLIQRRPVAFGRVWKSLQGFRIDGVRRT